MIRAPIIALGAVAGIAAIAMIVAFTNGGDGQTLPVITIEATTPTAVPERTPIPATWLDGVHPRPEGGPVLLSCMDFDRDGFLTGADEARFAGLRIALEPSLSCIDAEVHADYYAGEAPAEIPECEPTERQVLLVLVGGGGTDLLQAKEGESIGLLDIYNQMHARLVEDGVHIDTIIAGAAIVGARPPQLAMEQFIAAEVRRRMNLSPCVRAIILGHSHGGVTVTAALADLEDPYADRLLGVLLDRSAALYDGDPAAMPESARVLNYYQLNEGWHGVRIEQPNIENIDQSSEYAPIAPSDGGEGNARVTHKTLDDAPNTQRRVAADVLDWLSRE